MNFPKTFSDKNKEGIHAVIETPKGSRNKYDYNGDSGFYELKKILPAGTSFPLDFGFIPHTLAEDGDPVDVLVITDAPTFTGCVLQCRVIGVIEATQKEKGKKKERNDRVVAVSEASLDYSGLKHLKEMNEHLLNELVHFFEYYNSMCGKQFEIVGTKGPDAAIAVIKKYRIDKKN